MDEDLKDSTRAFVAHINHCPDCNSISITKIRRIKYRKTFGVVVICLAFASVSFVSVKSKPGRPELRAEMETLVRDSVNMAKSLAPAGSEYRGAYSKTIFLQSHTLVDVRDDRTIWLLLLGVCSVVLASIKTVEHRCAECHKVIGPR
jgi:hypothetical protein